MKVLFLTDNFPPEVNAPATRTYEHCKEWVRQGVEVTIITCAPNFPTGKVFPGYKNKLYQTEEIDGIRVIRVWSYITANAGFVKRILDFVSYAFMAWVVGMFQKPDIIIGTSPQFFTAVAAKMLALVKRRPWVMEVRDLWPESIAAVGAMRKDSIGYRMLHKVEKHLYKSANEVVVVTNSFKYYIRDLGISEDKIVVIKNGVDSSKFPVIEKDKQLLAKLQLKDKFIVGYIGTHGMAHALDFILECANVIEIADLHFILLGDGAEKENLVRKAKDLDLRNVTFLPFVAKSEIAKYISILDVALVNLKKSDTFKTVIPSKIFENACMEKPILLGVEGESKEIIEYYDAGVTYEPENVDAFLQAVRKIKNQENYKAYQQGCRRLANDYERNELARRMLSKILKYHK